MNLLTLIVQVAVILIAARVIGWLFRLIRQPQVVGEMTAGILLGPSLLGWVAPELSAAIFPVESLGYLNTLSQVGLLLFMFLVGLEFDTKLLRGRQHAVVVISHASIVAPFFLGSLLALYLYPRLSDSSVSFTGFALFMGAAMSVTAFPVLARILTERNLMRTRVGAITIACAAVDDVTAWTILAVVVAIVRANAVEIPLWLTLAGTAVYVVTMVLVVRKALGWLETYYRNRGRLTQDMLAGVLLLLLASAWVTEWLGIHALFGAFALGAVMPRERRFVHDVTVRLEDLTVVFLLPLFFAFTGLRTSIGLVNGAEMWTYFGLILLVAVGGKFGGSALAARTTGLKWREAGALGILMNTRGLMELVILTIGLELGVISPALFTMMVMMALATTVMTTPVLEMLYPARLIRKEARAAEESRSDYTVLLPVSLPGSGPGLLEAAASLLPADRPSRIYALHLERTTDRSITDLDASVAPARNEVLGPLLARAEERGIPVRPLSFVSHDIGRDIRDVAWAKDADLVLMGWHKPILGRSILSGAVSDVLRDSRVDVAVLVERVPAPWRRILALYSGDGSDGASLEIARRIASGSGAQLTILHVRPGDPQAEESEGLVALKKWAAAQAGVQLKLVDGATPIEAATEAAEGHDLIVASATPAWGAAPTPFGPTSEEVARASNASLLLVRSSERHRELGLRVEPEDRPEAAPQPAASE